MKRILYDVPRWHLYLHREARGLDTAHPGDETLLQFADELFNRLYCGESEALPPDQRAADFADWAQALHSTCEQLPSFSRLAEQCRGDAAAAATAVETLLQELNPKPPERQAAPPPPAQLRPAIRRACEKAASAVNELHEAQAGLEHVAFPAPGNRRGTAGAGPDTGSLALAKHLRTDERLRRIALLAGRFKRILASKRREKLKHLPGQIADIEQGADIPRLLPLELARLAHPRLKLAFLSDFAERRCLQYQLSGDETLGRGPLVVCLDKSGSMSGPRDIWSTAVALALLDVAHRERRPFGLLCFDAGIRYRAIVGVGQCLPQNGLFVSCDGGTDISLATSAALDIIAERPGRLRKADVVLITDGESDTSTAPELRSRAAALGVSILGFGIGIAPGALSPWCDESVSIDSLEQLDAKAADSLAGL